MNHSDGGAPAWLFSFVDLAFLMLIAMTQLAPDPDSAMPNLGEMIVPRIGETASTEMSASAGEVWQLRVHPPEFDGDASTDLTTSPPFELVMVGAGGELAEGERIAAPELRLALENLKRDRGLKPMLAPHQDSRSQDMLEAAAILEAEWPGRRRATVSRVFDRG